MHHCESGIISREKATHIFINCENKYASIFYNKNIIIKTV